MGAKGNNRHMKRLASPRYMKLTRKQSKFVPKPSAGRHTLENSIALLTFVKEKLELARNSREARKAITQGKIKVNGKGIKDTKFALGIGDIVEIVPAALSYEIVPSDYGVMGKREVKSNSRIVKVIGKYKAEGNVDMIRLISGENLKCDKKEIAVNDSVVIEAGKVKDVAKLEEGAKCRVIKGIHAPEEGTIKKITKGTAMRTASANIEGKNSSFETVVENIMAIK